MGGRRVAFREVDPDHEASGTLPQWVAQGGGNGGLHRPPVLGALDQIAGRDLEGLETEDPVPLAVGDDPLVVPIRQQLDAVDEIAEAFDRTATTVLQEPAAEIDEVCDVDLGSGNQCDPVLVDADDGHAAHLEPPEGRPQASSSAETGHVRP